MEREEWLALWEQSRGARSGIKVRSARVDFRNYSIPGRKSVRILVSRTAEILGLVIRYRTKRVR